jgi:hypothetical protein
MTMQVAVGIFIVCLLTLLVAAYTLGMFRGEQHG